MNSLDLLQPHLASIEELKIHLNQRKLQIPNIDNKSKDELLKIFYNYAVPMHKRGVGNSTKTISGSSSTTNRLTSPMQNVTMSNRRNNQIITSQTDDTNMKSIVRNFERTKIRIIEPNSNVQNSVNNKTYTVFNTNNTDHINNRKRAHPTSDNNKMVNDDEKISPKRKPISWP